jgi:hypothetical protein
MLLITDANSINPSASPLLQAYRHALLFLDSSQTFFHPTFQQFYIANLFIELIEVDSWQSLYDRFYFQKYLGLRP